MVAEKCYETTFLRENVWFVFNDLAYEDKLKENFEESFPTGSFKISPFFV